jgi:hypothetical protein
MAFVGVDGDRFACGNSVLAVVDPKRNLASFDRKPLWAVLVMTSSSP